MCVDVSVPDIAISISASWAEGEHLCVCASPDVDGAGTPVLGGLRRPCAQKIHLQ